MSSHNLTVGLYKPEILCMPDSVDTLVKCAGGNNLDHYALQTVSSGRRVVFKAIDQFSSASNFNGSFIDTSTMLGQLSVGSIDWVAFNLGITEKRGKYINFGFQHFEDRMCFFISRKWMKSANEINNVYFISVLENGIIQFFVTIMVLYILIKLATKMVSNKRDSLAWFRKASFGLASIFFVLFYNNNMKADFLPKTNMKLPFQTVEELAKLVESGNYHMVLNNLENIRMEMINNSPNTALRALKRALIPSKIKLVGSSTEMWNRVRLDRGAFTVNSWDKFLSTDTKTNYDVLEVCPNELPKLHESYGFPKKSKLHNVFNRRAHFIYAMHLRERKSSEGWQNYYASQHTPRPRGYSQISLANTVGVFGLHYALLSIYVVICSFEILYAKHVKTKSWDVPD